MSNVIMGIMLVPLIWLAVVLVWAFTFSQEGWDKYQKEGKYTADGDWRTTEEEAQRLSSIISNFSFKKKKK